MEPAETHRRIDPRIATILLLGCMLGSAASVPYQVHLLRVVRPDLLLPSTATLTAGAAVAAILPFGLAILTGLWLRRRTGLPMPLIDWVRQRGGQPSLASLGMAAMAGLATGIAIRVLDAVLFPGLVDVGQPPLWTRLLAVLYGGINEEILFRLFVMSATAALIAALLRRPQPDAAIRWAAILVSALAFALAHLPFTGALGPLDPAVVLRSVLLNGMAGTVFGWLCWRNGLEAAIVAHMAAGIAITTFV